MHIVYRIYYEISLKLSSAYENGQMFVLCLIPYDDRKRYKHRSRLFEDYLVPGVT